MPGQPDESEVVARIFAKADDEVMPPPQSKLALSDSEKRVLKQWIAAGAGYTAHWAFVAPKKAPPPEVRQSEWPRNHIDAFILARLEKERLKPSPPADRVSLIRRVSLDLLGLPPTPEEVDAFCSMTSPDAYERTGGSPARLATLRRTMGSPLARPARYADTNGYEKDRGRSIWPYRDWVIRAMNADIPFGRFTIEQIAGDMLPGATPIKGSRPASTGTRCSTKKGVSTRSNTASMR